MLINTGNISRKVLSKVLRSFDKNFERLQPTMIFSEKNKEILDGNRAKKEYLIKIPLRKYAVPEDVSSAILFLNSDKASMITGQNLIVDGGWTIY